MSVVSTLRSWPPMVAQELRRQADVFIELQDLVPRITRAPRQKEARISTPPRPAFDMADAGRPADDGVPGTGLRSDITNSGIPLVIPELRQRDPPKAPINCPRSKMPPTSPWSLPKNRPSIEPDTSRA